MTSQAKSNVDAAFRNVLDPELTQAGMEQARGLSLDFPFHNQVKAVFSSPLQRALQTALLAFGEAGSVGDKIVALPFAQETSDALCDTGRDPDALRELFPEAKIDYQYVVPGWNSKADIDANARATSLRDFLARQPEPELVLVTHGFFLHSLTEVRSKSTCSNPGPLLTWPCIGQERAGKTRRL
jgi:broad specificity phosphatase PhoE